MVTNDLDQDNHSLEGVHFLELAQAALTSQSLEQFMSFALPWIAEVGRSQAVFLYIVPRRTLLPTLHHRGLAPGEVSLVAELCRTELCGDLGSLGEDESNKTASFCRIRSDYRLWPLPDRPAMQGVLGVAPSSRSASLPPVTWSSFLGFMSQAISSFLDRMKAERQIAYLNTYLTVSSLLAQSLGLHDLMETVLYFCTDVVAAQEASVLLLDESKSTFTFYQTEGASRSVLMGKCFPADRGIAGSVLRNRKSEIVNAVQGDPRFYALFDSVSGVVTKSMIAIPLIAGAEAVGVLEVINKAGDLPFTDEDHLLLHFIADEISFGIRNAWIFEVLVNSYCKQRQGLGSCKDCIRPLKSWTPCMKQQEPNL